MNLYRESITQRNIALLKTLIVAGLDVNALDSEWGTRPLSICLCLDYADDFQAAAVPLLLSNGADPNLRSAWNETALHCAIRSQRFSLVQSLLAHNANPNQKSEGPDHKGGILPIMQAAGLGRQDIVLLLIDYGADPSIILNGFNAADYAVFTGNRMAEHLLGQPKQAFDSRRSDNFLCVNDILDWFHSWTIHLREMQANFEERVVIATTDNPGWSVAIKLQETEWQNKAFTLFAAYFNDLQRIECRVENRKFVGYGGPYQLYEILNVFRCWVLGKPLLYGTVQSEGIPKLLEWYNSQCDGEWEHCYKAEISMSAGPSWKLSVDLDETELQDKRFVTKETRLGAENWLSCRLSEDLETSGSSSTRRFEADGDSSKLSEIIRVFEVWATS